MGLAAARRLIDSQIRLAGRFDRLLPQDFRIDGNREFLDFLVPRNLKPGTLVYDVGGGKNPVVRPEQKAALGLRVIGLDIDGAELQAAPEGSYDSTVAADITEWRGAADADLVICQALLEHVRDTERALAGIAGILKPGGRALIFVPSRNAVYARLNLLLPERWKRKILFAVFPEMRRDHGFPAYYDRCTPADFGRMSRRHGMAVEFERVYFHSDYFRFFLPLHAVWRAWTVFFRAIWGRQAAETFALVLRKEARSSTGQEAYAGGAESPARAKAHPPSAALTPTPRTGQEAYATKTIVFGMNTMFAVRQFLPETLEMARRRGLRVVVIAPPGDSLPGIETCHVPMEREISPLMDLAALVRIWRILRSIRPAIVNMSTPKMGLLGGLAAWLAGVPHRIYTLRGLRYQTTRSWKRALLVLCERIACACSRQVICISRSVKETVVRDRIVAEKKTLLLGNHVSEGISLARRSAAPAGPCLSRSKYVIGFVGRLTRDKGIEDLIAAFRLLRTEGLDVQLLLLGDLESGDPIDTDTIETIRTHPQIRWLGPVPDATPYYPLMDVFVFPTHREGLGRVLLEAAAAGKPVVSTRTTGVVDVVIHGVTGILVPPRSPEALARATQLILTNPDPAARMGRRARQHVEQHFDNSTYMCRLASLLDSLAGTTKAPPAIDRSPVL